MSKIEEQVNQVWEEIIVKETLKTIITKLDKIEEKQMNNRKIIKEELTDLWNNLEIPTFKQILEKLTIIQTYLEQNMIEKGSTSTKAVTEEIKPPELTEVNVIGRSKDPVITDLSKSKPKITKGVKRAINGLAELHKQGKF